MSQETSQNEEAKSTPRKQGEGLGQTDRAKEKAKEAMEKEANPATRQKRLMTRGSDFINRSMPRRCILRAFCDGHKIAKAADMLGGGLDPETQFNRWLGKAGLSQRVALCSVQFAFEAGIADYQDQQQGQPENSGDFPT